MFMDDLKAFLMANNLGDEDSITIDRLPDQPDECIGLFCYAHAVPTITNGSATRRVQLQVRRFDAATAYSAAYEIFQLLDSGQDETVIELTVTRKVICRPTAGPKKLTEDDRRIVYYTEIALIGDDEP